MCLLCWPKKRQGLEAPEDSASSPAETGDAEGARGRAAGGPGDPTWPGLVLSEQGLYFGAGQGTG